MALNTSLRGELKSREREAAVLFSFDYPPNDGGIARLCAEIGVGWSLRDLNCLALCQESADTTRLAPPAVAERRVTRRRPWRELFAWRELVRLRGRSTALCGIWYPEGLLAVLARVHPLIVLAHGSELMPTRATWRRRVWRALLRRVCESADLVVANSEYTRRLVLQAAPHAKAVAAPLGVDHVRFSPGDRALARQRLGIGDGIVISSVSRVQSYKGHDVVLRALASVCQQTRRQIVYMVAGTGPHLEALRSEACKLNLTEQVRFLGFVPEQDLPDLYRASDLFVLCSREAPRDQEVEGFGLAFLEAQACGTPVVGTRTGGIPDAIREGEGGWLIDQDDAAALAGILTQLADDPAPFRAAGLAARRRVERECTWENYMERFLAALAEQGIRLG